MEAIDDKQVEAGSRRLLQEQITRSAWFRNGMNEKDRQERIKLEVEAWWHLKMEEARELLEERVRPSSCRGSLDQGNVVLLPHTLRNIPPDRWLTAPSA